MPSHVDPSRPEQRAAEASVLVPRGAVTGWAALRLHGGGFFDGLEGDGVTPLPVMLVAPGESRRRRPGVQIVTDPLTDDEVVLVQGVRCTTVLRAVFDQTRRGQSLTEAVVTVDMAAAAELTSITNLAGYVDQNFSRRGMPIARRALALASSESRSPQESRTRTIWIRAGLPQPLVNQPVYSHTGALLGYPDLLDPESGLVCEYDGADHRSARRHSDDVHREAGFRAHGLEATRLTGADIREPGRAMARLAEAHQRALRNHRRQQSWTLTRLDCRSAG
ncbi:MAG: hypothetical protein QM655_02240 [Nocardioidaceae bacterium]